MFRGAGGLLCWKQAGLLSLRVGMRAGLFEFPQFGNRNNPPIHPKQRERMKCNAKVCFEKQYQEAVQKVENHSSAEGPFFALAREIEEDNKNSHQESIDNDVQQQARAARAASQSVHQLCDP